MGNIVESFKDKTLGGINNIIVRGFAAEKITYDGVEYDTNEDCENAVQWAKNGSLAKIISM